MGTAETPVAVGVQWTPTLGDVVLVYADSGYLVGKGKVTGIQEVVVRLDVSTDVTYQVEMQNGSVLIRTLANLGPYTPESEIAHD